MLARTNTAIGDHGSEALTQIIENNPNEIELAQQICDLDLGSNRQAAV